MADKLTLDRRIVPAAHMWKKPMESTVYSIWVTTGTFLPSGDVILLFVFFFFFLRK